MGHERAAGRDDAPRRTGARYAPRPLRSQPAPRGGGRRQTVGVQLPQLRSPLSRAVVPVAAGIGLFVVMGLVLWGVAAWMSGDSSEVRLGTNVFTVGRIDRVASSIEASGPQLYPDLRDPSGKRSVVVDHTGGNDASGWHVYRPFPADRPGTECLAAQRPGTATFVDCEGRELTASELQPASDVQVIVEDKTKLVLSFAAAQAPATTATSTTPTGG